METGNNMDNNQENQISNLENKRKERHGILGIFYLVKGIFSVVLGAIPLVLVVMGFTGKLDETAAKLFPETFGNKQSYRAINTEEREQEDVPDEISQEKPIEESSGESLVVDNYTLDAIPKSSKDYGKYLHLGETYTNGDGDITMEIIDIGYLSDSGVITDDVTWGYTNVYIAIEVTNNSNSDIYFDQSNAILFIDDYEADKGSSVEVFQQNGYFIYDGTNSYPSVANVRSGGRKGTIGFIAMFTKNSGVTETSDIEFEVCGLVFKINPSFIVRELTSETATSNSGGIGNPIIDANPDRYVLEDGYIDGIDDGFYANSGNIELVPGEYYITGGANAILTITENAISMSGGKNNFENAEIKPAENGAPQYWVYVDGNYYAVVSFFGGGLYFRTDEADSDEDWDEGFYSKF